MNGPSPGMHLLLTIATPLVGAVVAWLLRRILLIES